MSTYKLLRALVVVFLVGQLTACSGDGGELVARTSGSDAGVPAYKPAQVEAAAPAALIGAGMRTCWVAPEQQPGELVVSKGSSAPQSPEQCLFLAPNNSWDLCSPTLHWYDGTLMNDSIARVAAWVPSGKHLRVQLYWEWMFGAPMILDRTYDGPTNVLEYVTAATSSIRTTYW